MYKRPGFRPRVQPGALRAALGNSAGVTVLALSLPPWAFFVVAAAAKAPWASIWLERLTWLPLIGLVAYLATVVSCLLLPPELPDDPGLKELTRIQRDMRERYKELREDTEHAGSAVLLTEVVESVRRMDTRVVPTFGQIVVKRNRLNQHLARYDRGEIPLPDIVLLAKLRQRNLDRQAELDACLRQASNVYAVLLRLLDSASDGHMLREHVGMWGRDLEDICDALDDVRSGLDFYDTALLGSGPTARDSAAVIDRLDRDVGMADGAGAIGAPPDKPERPTEERYPCGLTHREAEVLAQIAQGKTSKEIAAQLVVTVATVSRHIANIYHKIDARGRADATRFALEHGVV